MEEQEEVVVSRLTPQAYSLAPVVEPGVATGGTRNRKGNTNVRITSKLNCISRLATGKGQFLKK